jgi:hypothetical protein
MLAGANHIVACVRCGIDSRDYGPTGADVTTLSVHTVETEILFNKGVSFVVTHVSEKDASGKTYIYLEEA